jgi:hypothetical protein
VSESGYPLLSGLLGVSCSVSGSAQVIDAEVDRGSRGCNNWQGLLGQGTAGATILPHLEMGVGQQIS